MLKSYSGKDDAAGDIPIGKKNERRTIMIIQQIRNATLKITYGGRIFLVDPWLEDQGKGPAFQSIKEDMKRLAEDRHIKNLSVPENGESMEF